MASILLTGARGFVGRPCLDLLLEQGHEVHAVSSRSADPDRPDVKWHVADLRDSSQSRALINATRPDLLLHLAWVTDHGRYWTAPENHEWITGSLALIESFIERGGRRWVGVGTCVEYDWSRPGPYREDETFQKPESLYGQSKRRLQEQLAELACRTGSSQAWGRIFSPYGPREAPQRAIPTVIRSLLRGEPALLSSGRKYRDFLYVTDVARALIALLNSSVVGPVNIASGEGIRLIDVAQRIAQRLQAAHFLQIGALPDRAGEPEQLVADIARLRDEVGFIPTCSLDTGLALTTDWWSHHLPDSSSFS